MSMKTLEENIAKFEAAAERAELAAREANAATKALRQAEKDVRDLLDRDKLTAMVDKAMSDVMREGLDSLAAAFKKAQGRVNDRVLEQVDVILDLAIGKEGRTTGSKTDLRPDLAELIRRFVHEEVTKAANGGLSLPLRRVLHGGGA